MKNEILTKNQSLFLDKAEESPFVTDNFYLTGGTALSAFYLHHRYSEDLDFFSEKEFDILNLNIFFNGLKKKLPITKIDFQQSYNGIFFFLLIKKEVLKTEFTFFPFPRIEKREAKTGIVIDRLLDIAVNKLFTIYQRTQSRDFIDFYCICLEKGFVINGLIEKAKAKFDWHIDLLQLGSQFVKAGELRDCPRMVKDIPRERWQKFFIEEAKKLKQGIISGQ